MENSWWTRKAIRIYLKTKLREEGGLNVNDSGNFSVVSYKSLSKEVGNKMLNNTSMGKKGSLKKEGLL